MTEERLKEIAAGRAIIELIVEDELARLREENENLKAMERRVKIEAGWQEEIESLRAALEQISEFCGPPKMSESVGTMHTRLKQINQIIEALGKEGGG